MPADTKQAAITAVAASAAQGQSAPVVEGQAPAAQVDTQDVSSKFAHLARKTKSFREEQRRFQAEREAWKAEQTKAQEAFSVLERIGKDPIGVALERGVSEEQLASLLLNRSNPQEANHVFQLQQENKDLRAKIDQINKRFEDNDTQAYTQALNQIGRDAKILVNANQSDFELIEAAGEDGIEAIKELCKIVWDEDQVLLTTQEAAEMVEQELLERSLKLASAAKVKAKLSPAQAEAQAPALPTKNQTNQAKPHQTTTLNSVSKQATSKPMNARERAIAAFKGQL